MCGKTVGKCFAKCSELKQHLNSHDGAGVCDQCNVKFNRMDELRMHRRIVHRDFASTISGR